MPDPIAERLQMAIASEAAERAARSPGQGAGALAGAELAAGASGVSGASGALDAAGASDDADAWGAADGADEDARAYIPGRPDLPARTRRAARRPRMPGLSSPLLLRGLAAAGAVVIIAGAGFLLARGQISSQGTGTASSGTRPAPAAPGKQLSGPAAGRVPVGVHYRRNGKILTTTALASNTDYTRSTLAQQVRKEVANSARFSTGVEAQPATTKAPAKQIAGMNIPRLEGCLNLIAAGRRVLLADVARYVGRPAMIVVLISLKAAGVFDVAVVGLSCSASSAHMIIQATVPAG